MLKRFEKLMAIFLISASVINEITDEERKLYSCSGFQAYILYEMHKEGFNKVEADEKILENILTKVNELQNNEIKTINTSSEKQGIGINIYNDQENNKFKFYVVCEENIAKINEQIVEPDKFINEVDITFYSEKDEKNVYFYCSGTSSEFSIKQYSSFKCSTGMKIDQNNKAYNTLNGENDNDTLNRTNDEGIEAFKQKISKWLNLFISSTTTSANNNVQPLINQFSSQLDELKGIISYIMQKKYPKENVTNNLITPDIIFNFLNTINIHGDTNNESIYEFNNSKLNVSNVYIQTIPEKENENNDIRDGIIFQYYLKSENKNFKEEYFKSEGIIFNENPDYVKLKFTSTTEEHSLSIPKYITDKDTNTPEKYLEKYYRFEIAELVKKIYNLNFDNGGFICLEKNSSAASLQIIATLLIQVIREKRDNLLLYADSLEGHEKFKFFEKKSHQTSKIDLNNQENDEESLTKWVFFPKNDSDLNLGIYANNIDKENAVFIAKDDYDSKYDYSEDFHNFIYNLTSNHVRFAYKFHKLNMVIYIDLFDYSSEFYKSVALKFTTAFFTSEYIVPVGTLADIADYMITINRKVQSHLEYKLNKAKTANHDNINSHEVKIEEICQYLADKNDHIACNQIPESPHNCICNYQLNNSEPKKKIAEISELDDKIKIIFYNFKHEENINIISSSTEFYKKRQIKGDNFYEHYIDTHIILNTNLDTENKEIQLRKYVYCFEESNKGLRNLIKKKRNI